MPQFHKVVLVDGATGDVISIGTQIVSDTLTNRPAAGTAGRLYFANDVSGGTLYYDTGAAWIAISPSLARSLQTKNANFNVAATDYDAVFLVTSADKIATLPATIAGLRVTFTLAAAGLSAGTGLQIAPNAADKIMGNGLTSADNKALILTGATDREGDSVTLVGDGVDGWYIAAITGTWARAA
jgi:hypothetical protein